MAINKISFDNITIEYKDKVVLKDLSLDIHLNQFNTILGKSGLGKTSLLKELFNRLKNDYKVSFTFQDDLLIDWLTVKENLLLVMKDKNEDTIKQYLTELDMSDSIDLYPAKLSGGMKRRISLLRAFLNDNDIIILDEAFNSLDYVTKYKAMDFVKKHSSNKTIILVSHELDVVTYYNSYINILTNEGNITRLEVLDNTNKHLTIEGLINIVK